MADWLITIAATITKTGSPCVRQFRNISDVQGRVLGSVTARHRSNKPTISESFFYESSVTRSRWRNQRLDLSPGLGSNRRAFHAIPIQTSSACSKSRSEERRVGKGVD